MLKFVNKKTSAVIIGSIVFVSVLTILSLDQQPKGHYTAEEFQTILDRNQRIADCIQELFDFPILERAYSSVLHRVNNDPEEAVRALSHPYYPESLYGRDWLESINGKEDYLGSFNGRVYRVSNSVDENGSIHLNGIICDPDKSFSEYRDEVFQFSSDELHDKERSNIKKFRNCTD